MKKFVCEQNIAHFQKLLGETTDATLQRTLQALLSSAKARARNFEFDAVRRGPIAVRASSEAVG